MRSENPTDSSIDTDLEFINQQLKELTSLYRAAVRKSAISENEFWIWYALLILKGIDSQQDICHIWSLPKQTANTIISNLVKKGYVRLEVIPGTRNCKQICLSEQGRAYGEQIVMPIYRAERRALEQLSSDERAICRAAIQRYIQLMRQELCPTNSHPPATDSETLANLPASGDPTDVDT